MWDYSNNWTIWTLSADKVRIFLLPSFLPGFWKSVLQECLFMVYICSCPQDWIFLWIFWLYALLLLYTFPLLLFKNYDGRYSLAMQFDYTLTNNFILKLYIILYNRICTLRRWFFSTPSNLILIQINYYVFQSTYLWCLWMLVCTMCMLKYYHVNSILHFLPYYQSIHLTKRVTSFV